MSRTIELIPWERLSDRDKEGVYYALIERGSVLDQLRANAIVNRLPQLAARCDDGIAAISSALIALGYQVSADGEREEGLTCNRCGSTLEYTQDDDEQGGIYIYPCGQCENNDTEGDEDAP